MGFSSYKCAKSDISIPAFPYAGLPRDASDVVMVNRENEILEGIYDGYGRIDDQDIFDFAMGSEGDRDDFFENYDENVQLIKIVRADHYNGESFDELDTSKSCPDQGYFYGPDEKQEIRDSLPDDSNEPERPPSP